MLLMYPWFLLGLLAVAIPVAIHLLHLRRPQRVLFTNTAFIQDVELTTVRHRRLQHLLVLLARALAIIALVIAFCQPFIPAKTRENSTANAVVGISVDNSPSMQLTGVGSQRLFEEAVEQARDFGQSASTAARLRLLQTGNAEMPQAAFLRKLDELRLNGKSGGASLGEYNKHPIYIFSDFQRIGFAAKDIDALAERRQAILVPLAGKQAGNIYVDSLWLDDAFLRVRTNVALHVRLRNGGAVVVSECPVKVFLASRQVAAFRVTVEPGKALTTEIQVQLVDETLAQGRVVVEEQPVVFDNTYYFTLQPAAVIRVLEIGEIPIARQVYGNEPLFTYSFAKPGQVNFGALRQTGLVLVHELSQIDAGLREALVGVTKRGGTVVVVPSPAMSGRDSYQRLFKELGIGTAQWEASSGAPELREVAMPSVQEPFFRDVFGAQARAVTMPRAAPVLRWARTGTDILRLRDGESYLAQFNSGVGKVYVFSAPLAVPYSDFASHALFVPVMYRMAMLSYHNDHLPAYRLTQSSVRLELASGGEAAPAGLAAADEAGLRLVKDSLVLIPVQRVQGNEVQLQIPAEMTAPGFYQVQRRGKTLTTLAFNLDKRESELAAYSADELRQLIGPNRPNIRVVEAGANGGGLAALQAEQTGQPLWRYCLLLALLALLAEALLVRFGRKGASVPNRTAVAA
ncbi:BatA domain-containing protein [Hymenobacter ruricola]|uniref:BatA domain-containing protein n=1 Tax=Hymenobacter ruricola TaxID=2791023 RepID=A0ABS0IBI3_9BACT|nr:BatA domain-containing protein [Hymenobacter ruricola]MBF9224341.1 BatA domain-containing protein [Hymenobacter ruricola]